MKKKCITGFAILLCVIGFIMTGCGSDDPTAPEATAPIEDIVEDTTQEPEEEPVVDEDTEEVTVAKNYYELGDTIQFENGAVTINDIGIYSEDNWAMMYILIDAQNTSDESIGINQADGAVYADDYQVTSGIGDTSDDTLSILMSKVQIDGVDLTNMPVSINAGRRIKYIMYVPINDSMDAAQTVEYEIFGKPILFKQDGKWKYGSGNDQEAGTEEWISDGPTDGIGNPTIDDDPDKYIPDGINGYINPYDHTFYSNKPVNGIVPGEYLILDRGSNAVIIIEGDKMSLRFSGSEYDFEDATLEELTNCPEAYSCRVYGNGKGYVVSFYEGGLYLYTDEPDSENDYLERFYEKM